MFDVKRVTGMGVAGRAVLIAVATIIGAVGSVVAANFGFEVSSAALSAGIVAGVFISSQRR